MAAGAEVRRGRDLRPRFGLDGDKLIAAVAAWTPAQTLAVLDAFERFRASMARDGWTDVATVLRAVGPLRDGSR